MGERCALRFVGKGEKNVSPWLYFHNGGVDFYAVSLAVEYIQKLPEPDPTDGRAGSADHLVVDFIKKSNPDRIWASGDPGDGSGMDWGAWEVDVHTGIATARGEGSHGVKQIAEPWAWDSDEMEYRPSGNQAEPKEANQ